MISYVSLFVVCGGLCGLITHRHPSPRGVPVHHINLGDSSGRCMNKTCSICRESFPATTEFFHRSSTTKGGFHCYCKKCSSVRMKSYTQQPENKERASLAARAWRQANRDRTREHKRRWAKKYRAEIDINLKEWKENNPDKWRAWQISYGARVDVRIRRACRARLHAALDGRTKCGRTTDFIGCSVAHLKAHLESLWQEGMSWDNYGFRGWHIDHIRPCASFDLSDPAQQRECFHYTNLQPLWAKENIAKGKKEI